MKKYQLAVFDMAGTTVEEGGSVYRVLAESILDAGYEVPADKLSQIAGMSKYEAIIFILPDKEAGNKILVDSIFKTFQERLNQIYREDPSVTEKPGISELFSKLRGMGIKVALNTGYSRAQADLLINRLGWASSIDASITSDEVERGRPYPDMINTLMQQLKVSDSKQIIKVGDTVNDMLEGNQASCGLKVGVLGGAHDEAKLREAGADLILHKTSDLELYLTEEANIRDN